MMNSASSLRLWLTVASYRAELLQVKGIGPKTIDYLGCLVGLDAIAADRHVRTFAKDAGLEIRDYDALKAVFCTAADLLGTSRRAFDAWIWRRISEDGRRSPQHDLFADAIGAKAFL